jgi:tetratricopeptide (TPR) repeat protein
MSSRCLVSLAACLALIPTGLRAQQRPLPSCDQYEVALRADPKNLEAAARLGQCSVRDYEMIAPGGDSSRLAFRSSWTTALRALRRAVELDPTYDRAYRPLFAILFAETRDGCSFATSACTHVAANVRDGDSVITTPRLVRLNTPGVDTYDEVISETQNKGHPNITEARDLAARWATVAPNDRRPHEYLGQALLRLGDPARAADELERAALLGDAASRRNLFWNRFEALVKSDRGADARRVLDEAVSDPARDTTHFRSYTVAGLNALVGRHRAPAVDSNLARQNRTRLDSILRSHPAEPVRPGFSARLAAGDTAGARRELAQTESGLTPRDGMRRFPRIGIMHLESAVSRLALGDTAVAETRLAEIEDVFNHGRFQFVTLMFEGDRPWLGRVWMLSGNLAAARRRFPDAARMYRRVIGLWGGGDPDVQPLVDEARAKLASLPVR